MRRTVITRGRLLDRVDRVSSDDLMSLVSERGSRPLQVGAVLMLDVPDGIDPAELVRLINGRLPAVPRLRQRLVRAPFGCGRPVWADHADFQIDEHLVVTAADGPYDTEAVLRIAADLLKAPLSRDRPLWAARLVTNVTDHRAALVLVFHHVLADGIAGLAVLAGLVDGTSEVCDPGFPRPAPSRFLLAGDALRERFRALRTLPTAAQRLASAAAELGPTIRTRSVSCSLNQPTGPGRRFVCVSADLGRIHDLSRRNDATVNDVVLAAITGALRRLLADRGETMDAFVISIPFSSRTETTGGQLGNQSGVIPLLLPATGTFEDRVTAIAELTRAAKGSPRGTSAALLAPAFRLLARLGLFQRFVNHQQMIHTFVSNLKGPADPLRLLGCPITEIIPLSIAIGNVTVAFTVLSYAGLLTITLNADPETCPDLDRLRDALEEALRQAQGT